MTVAPGSRCLLEPEPPWTARKAIQPRAGHGDVSEPGPALLARSRPARAPLTMPLPVPFRVPTPRTTKSLLSAGLCELLAAPIADHRLFPPFREGNVDCGGVRAGVLKKTAGQSGHSL